MWCSSYACLFGWTLHVERHASALFHVLAHGTLCLSVYIQAEKLAEDTLLEVQRYLEAALMPSLNLRDAVVGNPYR